MISLKTRFTREYNRLYTKLLKFFLFIQGTHAPSVYMFHSVVDKEEDLYSKFAITKKSFDIFLKSIIQNGMKSMDEKILFEAIDNPSDYKNHFIVTFDDIYDSVYTNAYPILKRYNIPFVIFVTPNLIGKVDTHSGKTFITNDHLNELLQDPLCILGSHSLEHVPYRKYSKTESLYNLMESKNILENRYNRNVNLFAFPYGRRVEVSNLAIKCLQQTNYKCAFSAINGSIAQKWISGKYFLPRILVDEAYVSNYIKSIK